MTKRACTRTSNISVRLLATLGVVLGFAVISADAGAGLAGGLLVGTDCAGIATQGLTPATPPLTGLTGSLTSAPCATGSGDVSSFVDYGVMKTIGHATSSGALGFGQSSTHILFNDLVTFDPVNSLLIGQSATIQAQVQLQALLTGNAQWSLDVTFGGTTDSFSSDDVLVTLGHDCSSPCTFDLTLGMTLGTPTLLQVDLQAVAAPIGSSSSFDLSQSVYWDGIQSVTVDGQPVAFSLISASGHDWTLSSVPGNGSAPEPASLALLALGLAGLGFARRQSIRANQPLKIASRCRRTHSS